MVALSELNKSRVYFHLGIGVKAAVDAGDLAQVEEACNTIPDNYMHNRVLEQLDICDEAWEASRLTRIGGNRFTTRESYAGDLNRSIIRDSAKDNRIWMQNYLDESQALAQLLWVPNYRMPEMQRYRFERSGASYINILKGVADTSTSSRRLEFQQLAGSFGIGM